MSNLPKVPQLDKLPSAAYKTVVDRLAALEQRLVDKMQSCVDSLIVLNDNIVHETSTRTTEISELRKDVATLKEHVVALRQEDKESAAFDLIVGELEALRGAVMASAESKEASSVMTLKEIKNLLATTSEDVGGIQESCRQLLEVLATVKE